MRKQTAPRTRKHRKASPPQQSGLIAGENNAPQSATPRSALDNRSHRTSRVQLRAGALDALVPHAAQYGQLTPLASAASRPGSSNAC